jgi:Zn finger protein HypA/HybF involved in hydrogenase expression
MKFFKCTDCKTQFNKPIESTVQASEYYGAKAWTYTTEHCPDCKSQRIDFTVAGKAAFEALEH